MLALDTAIQLKDAGLPWNPAEHDMFFIPFQDLDEQLFVISEMTVVVESMGDSQAIMFNGASEWALDYVVLQEAVWSPTESQLREFLERQLVERGEPQPVMLLATTSDGYYCEIQFKGQRPRFDAFGAAEAYAEALLFVLRNA